MGGMRWQQQDIQGDTFSGPLELRPETRERPEDAAWRGSCCAESWSL